MSTMTTQGVLVTLTGTDNTYLQPELPVRGRLHIIECGTDGSIITANFRREKESGGFYVPVEVRSPRFSYGEPQPGIELTTEPTTAAEHYQHAGHHLAQAAAIDKAQIRSGRTDGELATIDRLGQFDRHVRLAELHVAMAQARTAGAALIKNRPGYRAGSSAEATGWDHELRAPARPRPATPAPSTRDTTPGTEEGNR